MSASASLSNAGAVVFRFQGQSALASWTVSGPVVNSTFFDYGLVRVLLLSGSIQFGSQERQMVTLVELTVAEFQQSGSHVAPLFLFDANVTGINASFDTSFPQAPKTASVSVDVTGIEHLSGRSVTLHLSVSWSGSDPTQFVTRFHLTGTFILNSNGFIDQTSSARGGISGTAFDISMLGPAIFSQLESVNQVATAFP